MVYVVKEANTKNGQEKYLARNPPDLRTRAIEEACRYPSYPDAMAAVSVLAAQNGTEKFDYEVIEVA